MASKEEKILELFFEEPTKHWHFENIMKTAKVSRAKAGKWLKKLAKERIIRHIKPEGKMPYFQGDFESPAYRSRKRLFSLSMLQTSGFLSHLMSLPKAKTVIIFGSFVRADWYKDSDIDVFIYGSDEGLDIQKYRSTLRREIQVFAAESVMDLEKFGPGLLRNILEGIIVKGKIDFVEVMPLAAI